MTAPARKRENKTFTQIESEIVAVTEEIILESIDANRTHCFCGLQFFSDAEGEVPAVPTAGFVKITIQTVNTYPTWEPVPVNMVNAAAPKTIGWDANTRTVKATPNADIVDAAYYRLVITCNGT